MPLVDRFVIELDANIEPLKKKLALAERSVERSTTRMSEAILRTQTLLVATPMLLQVMQPATGLSGFPESRSFKNGTDGVRFKENGKTEKEGGLIFVSSGAETKSVPDQLEDALKALSDLGLKFEKTFIDPPISFQEKLETGRLGMSLPPDVIRELILGSLAKAERINENLSTSSVDERIKQMDQAERETAFAKSLLSAMLFRFGAVTDDSKRRVEVQALEAELRRLGEAITDPAFRERIEEKLPPRSSVTIPLEEGPAENSESDRVASERDLCACIEDLIRQLPPDKTRLLKPGSEGFQSGGFQPAAPGLGGAGGIGADPAALEQLKACLARLSEALNTESAALDEARTSQAAYNAEAWVGADTLDMFQTASEEAGGAQQDLAQAVRDNDAALEEMAPSLDQATTGTQNLGRAANITTGEFEHAREEMGELERIGQQLGTTVSGALRDLISGGKDFGEVLEALEQQLLGILERAVFGQQGGLGDVLGAGFGSILQSVFGPGPLFAQHGGTVHGPGGPRGDRIPALLSDGEFVVNAKAARRNRRILEAINAERLPLTFAGGGLASLPLVRVPAMVGAPRGVPQAAPADTRPGTEIFNFNFHGVRDADTFKNNAAQIRHFLLEVIETAKRRDR